MSLHAGTRRLLIALSGLYWISAIVAALAFGLHEQRLCVDNAVKAVANDTLYRELFAACQPTTPIVAAGILGYAGVVFGILAAIYFAVRWVVRGFCAPA